MRTVTNMNTLKAMRKRGLVKFCGDTGSKITGLYGGRSFICYYVDGANINFTYKGGVYTQKYFDGCFFPYVVQVK